MAAQTAIGKSLVQKLSATVFTELLDCAGTLSALTQDMRLNYQFPDGCLIRNIDYKQEENIMSNLVNHAKLEFLAAGWVNEDGKFNDEMQEMICGQVIELLTLFSGHGHSGSSAPYAINMFKTLAYFEPLVPLSGNDSEWCEVSEGLFQNKRCSHVFKGSDGKAYDIRGRVFRGSDGGCYTSRDSRVYIDFPYTPKTEYVDVEAHD